MQVIFKITFTESESHKKTYVNKENHNQSITKYEVEWAKSAKDSMRKGLFNPSTNGTHCYLVYAQWKVSNTAIRIHSAKNHSQLNTF